MKRIYRIIYFNYSFNFQWHFQLDWCIMNIGDMKFHSSYIIPPFGCFRYRAAISFFNENEKSFFPTSHFSLWDFFTAPIPTRKYFLMRLCRGRQALCWVITWSEPL